jgi:O-antigen/teichoic acid export membrane protein
MVDASAGELAAGEHERHLAISAIAQQITGVLGLLSMLAAITVLARRLPLSVFGTYGLLVSFTSYVLFAQRTIETATVKAIAEAIDARERIQAYSTALLLYVGAGLMAGIAVTGAGIGLLSVLGVPASLHHQARLGVLALGVVTAVGWPFNLFQDVLRGMQLFLASAAAEAVAFIAVAGTLVGLALSSAPLWLLIGVGAAVPLATGIASALVVRARSLPFRFERSAITLESLRRFLSLSTYLFITGISDLVIYSLDRAVLAAFRSAAAVGLYEGPARAHGMLQQVHSALATPVVSASARYAARRDVERTRLLLLRGARYQYAAVIPPTIVLMILAKPILKVWIGPKFEAAATAMVILTAYWLLNAGVGVPGRMLVAAGRARTLALYAGGVALANLGLSLGLTPSLGLNGVVLGTTIAYALGFPFFVWVILSTFPVTLGDLVRDVWVPAYVTGAVVAGGLLAVRLTLHPGSLPSVIGSGLVTVGAYWAIYYVVWLKPAERVLVKSVVSAPLRLRRG